jgi:hypothetical protein
MRLVDLSPRWVSPAQWANQSPPYYVGVSFDCPCVKCRAPACPTCGHAPDAKRLQVSFWPHIDPQGAVQQFSLSFADHGEHRRTGDTFDTLTLSPSVGFEGIGHFHGHISNGEVTLS